MKRIIIAMLVLLAFLIAFFGALAELARGRRPVLLSPAV
jgi:hypothetical protein